MSKPARNDHRLKPLRQSQGIALLVMLGIILIAFTAVAISKLSVNSGEQKARAKTTQALAQSRDAIMAFALAPSGTTNPPGRLPCPDSDGDGFSNNYVPAFSGPCPRQRGLVPFMTLNIPQPVDGTGAPIWYVVANEYSDALPPPYNSSSTASTLRIVDPPPIPSRLMAFILLAPNKPISGQVRTSLRPLYTAALQFLEGENADGTLNTYTDVRDDNDYDTAPDTQNDQVLGMPMGTFWTHIEGRVLREIDARLDDYFRLCGSTFPFAVASFGDAGDVGLSPNRRGGLPFDLVPQCTGAVAFPDWLRTHWSQTFYYESCPPATPNCIELRDANNLLIQRVSAIVVAPGIALSTTTPTQTRPAFGVMPSYFERENDNTTANSIYTHIKPINHPATFNDRIHIIR